MPLRPSANSTKGVPATEWPQDFTFLARLWDMPFAPTIKLVGVKMVRNLLSPTVVRDGTPRLCFHDTLSSHGATWEIHHISLTKWYRGPLKK